MASLLLAPSRHACQARILGIRSFTVSTSALAKKQAKKHSATVATNPSTPTSSATTTTTTTTATTATPPKQTKNPFTASANANSVLAYVGPYASTLRQCKSVAFVFGACGCIAVPSTLYLGNTEHVLAIMAGVASLTPSLLLHQLFKNDVTKIHVQGKTSTSGAIQVSVDEPFKLIFEKLSWRGAVLQTQVLSNDLHRQDETDKSLTWIAHKATTPPPPVPASVARANSQAYKDKVRRHAQQAPTSQTYRINKAMLESNPSFAFLKEQVAKQ
ncbi:hypothetical protein BGZ52_006094 [Haplosporangium bisporale]|nr:hypothetical protein BGZ52_006094 [Haplosporangium bisporale]